MARVALFGLPASGKGTLAKKMQEQWGWEPLSTGDMVRRMRSEQTPIGEKLRALPPGTFADDALILDAVKLELENPKYAKGVIFDGFPRTLAQLDAMEAVGVELDVALYLEADEDELVARAESRRVHIPSGRVYNIKTAKPKQEGVDDVTGEPLTWREDDHEEVARRRFADYWLKTHPIVETLRKQAEAGRLRFVAIDGRGDPRRAWEEAEKFLVSSSRNRLAR